MILSIAKGHRTLTLVLATKPPKKVNGEKPKSYVDVLKRSIKNEGNRKKENGVSQKPDLPHKDTNDKFKRYFPPKWPRITQYQNSFFGYCFSCNHFSHKVIDCRAYAKKRYVWNKNKSSYGFLNKNYNSIAPLLDYNVVCYNYNNYGHIARFCRSGIVESPRQKREEKERIHKSLENDARARRENFLLSDSNTRGACTHKMVRNHELKKA